MKQGEKNRLFSLRRLEGPKSSWTSLSILLTPLRRRLVPGRDEAEGSVSGKNLWHSYTAARCTAASEPFSRDIVILLFMHKHP